MANPHTVYLLDASIYVFRAWFSLPDSIRDQRGRPVNAVLGYWRLLLELLVQLKPRLGLVAFDESLFSGFRHQLYQPYKSNRALPDEELAYQLELCRLLTEALGIPCRSSRIYEADDVLASAATLAHTHGLPVMLLTRDKDLAQLVMPGDFWWDWSGGLPQDHAALCERWQVPPARIPDLLALAGDAVDNIPGVKGIGIQSATKLIRHFGDLENLYSHLDALADVGVRGCARIQRALLVQQHEAFLFRELIRLHEADDLDEPISLAGLQLNAPNLPYLRALIGELQLGRAFLTPLERYFS
ncbi:MAG: hypothetical protein HPY82_02155 [Gammaproteobacteria bacterium]|nr:hypothetical protein [Gammaproteobacteria bacterium]